MRTIHLFNSWGMKKETFVPQVPGKVSLYCCGPTVYSDPHIGNFRPVVTFDVLRRLFLREGYQVTFVSNYTDVDDKIIQRAKTLGITEKELTTSVIAEYRRLVDEVGALQPDYTPTPTVFMPQIISYVEDLVNNGSAYVADGDVYLSVRKIPGYGSLSGNAIEDLESGARIAPGDKKKDPLDFALWKAAKSGEPYWDSPFSKGRPGWHIECSAMAGKYLGKTIDIHCGGEDLIFPHHENEIAQSECANGCEFAHYWMHNGYINVDNRKMSKSLNNFFTVREVANVYGYEPIRYIMVASHYRSPINYSAEVIEGAKASLERLYTLKHNLDFAIENAENKTEEIPQFINAAKTDFINALSDDLNTADAMGVLFTLVKNINILISENPSKETLVKAKEMFLSLADVLGLLYNDKNENINEDVNQEIEDLIVKRNEARKAKDFKTADSIRDKLKEMGIAIEDTPQGTNWRKI